MPIVKIACSARHMFQLRPYQQEAVDLAIAQLKTSTEPFIIEAATGAGKSVIIAEIARIIHEMTGKRILVTAPTSELVVQDRAKYIAAGNPASMFSASAGPKSLRHPVVFGTPGTVKNRISPFQRDFALIIIDEGDLITPTIKSIIEAMREGNPNLRVMALTATPFRLGSGFIFREWPDGSINGEDVAREPYYGKCIYRIEARALIEQGYLTPPVLGSINATAYETDGLLPNRQGKFDAHEVDRAYHGHGRKTSRICQDIITQSQGRRGVILYAATIQHAQEIMASLPPELSAIITGGTKDRESILKRFGHQKIKYVVNVGVLTVGVDMPHVDVIAILRRSESIRLLQQIVGRGIRLFEGKTDCLVLDYGKNFEVHCPDGDLFKPVVRAKSAVGPGTPIEAECPDCGYTNEFTLQPDYADFARDAHGYCLDVFGAPLVGEHGPVPAHYGRRCFGMVRSGSKGEYVRCNFRYGGKECDACGENCDIAARYCKCGNELVDPNSKLTAEFVARKKDVTQPQTEKVLSLEWRESISTRGNATIRADFVTPYKQFSCWYMKDPKTPRQAAELDKFMKAVEFGTPETVSYCKDSDTAFFRIIAFNKPPDDEDLPIELMERKEIAKLQKYG